MPYFAKHNARAEALGMSSIKFEEDHSKGTYDNGGTVRNTMATML